MVTRFPLALAIIGLLLGPGSARGAESAKAPEAWWSSEGHLTEPLAHLQPLFDADPAPHPLDPYWVAMTLPSLSTRTTRYGLTEHAGQLVVTGRFGLLGNQRLQRGGSWDGAQFTDLGLRGLFWGFSTVEWNGALVVGGTGVGTSPTTTLFRRTGVEWESLATTNGIVRALAVFDGDLVAAGDFTVIGGITANRVARYDGSAWHAMGAGFPSASTVNDLLQVGSYLYVSGSFSGANAIKGVGRWDGTSWSTVGAGLGNSPNPTSEVFQLATDGVDVFACGGFSFSGIDSVRGVARWDGTSWTRLAPGQTAATALARWNGTLYANMPDGADRISKLSGGFWTGAGDAIVGGVSRLGVAGGRLVALGLFGPASGSGDISSIRVFDGTTWTTVAPPWGPEMTGMDQLSFSAAVVNDHLYVGGDQVNVGNTVTGLRVNGIAAWDGNTWTPLQNGVLGQVRHVGAFGSDVLVGGFFSISGLSGVSNFARWNGTTWAGFGTLIDQLSPAYVWATTEHGGALHAGGDFFVGSSNHVARWNGSSWEELGVGVGPSSFTTVRALRSWNGVLVAGGKFATAGGVPAPNIASWDGGEWRSLEGGLNGDCLALTVLGTDLIAGGDFTEADGLPAPGAALWDGVEWRAMGTMARTIRRFALVDGVLYAVGRFMTGEGTIVETAARWTGLEWQILGSGAEPTFAQLSWVEGFRGDLFVGGSFTHLMGRATSFIMRLPAVNTLEASGDVRSGSLTLQAAPNPGRVRTTFRFALPSAGRVRLAVFDAAGRRLATLVDGEVISGRHEVSWGAPAPPGVYFARLEAIGGATRVTRFVRID